MLHAASGPQITFFKWLTSSCKLKLQCVATDVQLREDVTRYRYGDEQHLDESLGKIFMFNRVSQSMVACVQ